MAAADDLQAAVEARYSRQLLLEISQSDETNETDPSEDRIALACEDVISDFETYSMSEFDSTSKRHMSFAIRGVVKKLRSYAARAEDESKYEDWCASLEAIRSVEGNNRVAPTTDSHYEPTQIPEGTLPDMDRRFFDGLVPGRSAGGGGPGSIG